MDRNVDVSSSAFVAERILNRNLVPNNPAARVLDIALIVLAAPYIILACLLIMLLIVLDSDGPVLFSHTRVGRFGRKSVGLTRSAARCNSSR